MKFLQFWKEQKSIKERIHKMLIKLEDRAKIESQIRTKYRSCYKYFTKEERERFQYLSKPLNNFQELLEYLEYIHQYNSGEFLLFTEDFSYPRHSDFLGLPTLKASIVDSLFSKNSFIIPDFNNPNQVIVYNPTPTLTQWKLITYRFKQEKIKGKIYAGNRAVHYTDSIHNGRRRRITRCE